MYAIPARILRTNSWPGRRAPGCPFNTDEWYARDRVAFEKLNDEPYWQIGSPASVSPRLLISISSHLICELSHLSPIRSKHQR